MENKKLHIIITGETGKGRRFSLSKNVIRHSIITLTLLTFILGYGSLKSIYYQAENKQLQAKTIQLGETRNQLAGILQEKEELINSYQHQVEELINSYQHQVAALKQDQEELLEGSISKLDERAKVIEDVIDQLGVKVKIDEDPGHSGGLYIAMDESYSDKLIYDTDRYLTALQKMPLGPPINTRISSRFGKRTDPLNKKKAFHAGIDFRGTTGDNIKATGNGVVKKSTRNKGSGNYIIISHENGYETKFAHLSKRLVKKGEKIARGQVIGLLGNTGRSTGSHLHYEIRRYGKAINPMKYLKVSDLTVIASK